MGAINDVDHQYEIYFNERLAKKNPGEEEEEEEGEVDEQSEQSYYSPIFCSTSKDITVYRETPE